MLLQLEVSILPFVQTQLGWTQVLLDESNTYPVLQLEHNSSPVLVLQLEVSTLPFVQTQLGWMTQVLLDESKTYPELQLEHNS